MEGIFFYFMSWTLWIVLTFLVSKKNQYRSKLAVIILLLIISANVKIQLGFTHAYLSGFTILFIAFSTLAKERKRIILYLLLCSSIIAMAYSTFHLFELFDPVWLFMKREWMLGVILCYLTILLQKSLKFRILLVMIGSVQGEIFNSLILGKYSLNYVICTPVFLDVCAISCTFLVIWTAFEHSGKYFDQYFPFFAKENQKTS